MLKEPSQRGTKKTPTTNQTQTCDTEQIPNKSRHHLRFSQTIRGK